jgi:hypothetical protein
MKKRARLSRHDRRAARYWDDAGINPASLGCSRCADLKLCGGLFVRADALDCTTYCCGQVQDCDMVCQRNATFVDRVWEVGGFDLANVARAAVIDFPTLPHSVPLIYSRGARRGGFFPKAAGASFYQLFERRSHGLRFVSKAALCDFLGVDTRADIILSGTAEDPPLERWWSLGEKRREALASIAALGIRAVTSPNYSLFSDVPRWDNFHSMKRIAICWQEIVQAGIPTALHVNARAPNDWQRWTEFVQDRPEVTAIAYEFATGAAGPIRMTYHVDELRHLADRVGRPLTLIVRGAIAALDELRKSFAAVVHLESTSYMKTANRKIGRNVGGSVVRWSDAPGKPNVCVDHLMEHNHLTMSSAAAPADA